MKAINRGVLNPRDWKPEENLPLAVEALRSAKKVLVTMHRGPDGDALGSALALACALRDLGREVTVYNPDELPYNFRFLPGAAEVARTLEAGAAFDVTIATDAGSFDRLGPEVPEKPRRGILLNLDHHITTEPV
ncbi:MAG: DHH family phosphoesterase, partial [Myxococcaceae bacterium]